MKQKLLLIALTLLMPVTAFAWYNGPDGFYDFEVDSIYYEIVSEAPPKVRVCSKYWHFDYSGSMIEYLSDDYSGDLVIPDDVTYEGTTYAVTDICWNAFMGCSDLESISVPASITNITITGYWMGVQEGVSPNGTNGVKSIEVAEGNLVFDSRNDCNAIIETSSNKLIAGCDNTIIPNTVTAIGTSAFVNCNGLTNVILPNSITEIGQSAYACCYYLNTIEIPCSVSYIGPCAFLRSGLTEFVWPDSCHSISNGVFNECHNLKNIKIPSTVTTIESCAFFFSNLSHVTIPNSVTTIGDHAFAACINLVEVNSVATVPPSIGSNTFDYSDRTTLYVPQESCDAYRNANGWQQFYRILPIRDIVELNGLYYTFTSDSTACLVFNNENCYSGEIIIPESVSYNGKEYVVDAIDQSAFYWCSELTSIEIPNTVKTIGACAFFHCSGLTSIEIPNSVITIGEQAFEECSGLVSVIIGNSVTSIGNNAFYYCSNLVEVNCLALNPPSISLNTFNCYDRATLIVPRKSVESYRQDYYWRRFSSILASSSAIEVNGICYDYTSDSTVCVTFRNESYNSYSGNIVIPESVSYNGKDYIVNAIDERAFYNCSGLIGIMIPNTVTTIGNYAFYGCSGLTSIDIPNSITLIGDYAFRNCTGLLNVNIPDSVSTIGTYSFYGCSGLSSLTIGKSVTSIGNNAFNGCNNLKELTWNTVNCTSNGNISTSNIENVTIGSEVEVLPNYFVSGSKITAAGIPNSVKSIGRNAFSDCEDLTSIEMPNSVSSIGIYAFCGCSNLISVIISNSVTSIGDNVFQRCYSLSNIIIPNSVSSIGDYVFQYCNSLKTITIPNSVSSIGNYAFYGCSRMMSVDIPSSVTSIGSFAFYDCNALSKVTISDIAAWSKITYDYSYSNPLYYAHHLYMNGQEIKQLVIPEGVTAINNYAFVNGTSFLELTLPNTLESIGHHAFEGCKRLSNVALGFSMKAIGAGAFKDCTAINSVTCLAPTPPTMEAVDCFDSDCYDWATLYVPGDKVDEYKSTLYWNKFANTFGTGIEVDGLFYLFDPDKGEATVTYKDETYCSYTGEVMIPETVNYGGAEYTVTGIGKAAFAYCDELSSVAIPNTVTSIGDYAFMYCEGLTSITIPDSVKSIGDNSFDGCGALCVVEIPNSVASIGDMAFQGCTSLTDITVGSGVTYIGAKAFNYCNSLHSVTCMGSVPPLMDNSDCFTSYGYEATLKVPQTSIEDYQSSNYWYKFAVIEGFGGVEPGDVDGDGNLNISDVTALIDLLLSGGEALPSADVNEDGQVNISDVTALIDTLLSGN